MAFLKGLQKWLIKGSDISLSSGDITIGENQEKKAKAYITIYEKRVYPWSPHCDQKSLCTYFTICALNENMRLDRELTDWGVSMSHSLSPKIYSKPDMYINRPYLGKSKLASVAKTKFCAFVFSTNDIITRNRLYEQLSAYRRIDAFGNMFRNMSSDFGHHEQGWLEENIERYRSYKFVISFENSMGLHYYSEKLFSGILAGAVPIYWGCPNVTQYYNPESFINAHDFESLESLVEYIIKIDKDDALYERYRVAPMHTAEQLENIQQEHPIRQNVLLKYPATMEAVMCLPNMQANSFLREYISCAANELVGQLLDERHRLARAHRWMQRLWPVR